MTLPRVHTVTRLLVCVGLILQASVVRAGSAEPGVTPTWSRAMVELTTPSPEFRSELLRRSAPPALSDERADALLLRGILLAFADSLDAAQVVFSDAARVAATADALPVRLEAMAAGAWLSRMHDRAASDAQFREIERLARCEGAGSLAVAHTMNLVAFGFARGYEPDHLSVFSSTARAQADRLAGSSLDAMVMYFNQHVADAAVQSEFDFGTPPLDRIAARFDELAPGSGAAQAAYFLLLTDERDHLQTGQPGPLEQSYMRRHPQEYEGFQQALAAGYGSTRVLQTHAPWMLMADRASQTPAGDPVTLIALDAPFDAAFIETPVSGFEESSEAAGAEPAESGALSSDSHDPFRRNESSRARAEFAAFVRALAARRGAAPDPLPGSGAEAAPNFDPGNSAAPEPARPGGLVEGGNAEYDSTLAAIEAYAREYQRFVESPAFRAQQDSIARVVQAQAEAVQRTPEFQRMMRDQEEMARRMNEMLGLPGNGAKPHALSPEGEKTWQKTLRNPNFQQLRENMRRMHEMQKAGLTPGGTDAIPPAADNPLAELAIPISTLGSVAAGSNPAGRARADWIQSERAAKQSEEYSRSWSGPGATRTLQEAPGFELLSSGGVAARAQADLDASFGSNCEAIVAAMDARDQAFRRVSESRRGMGKMIEESLRRSFGGAEDMGRDSAGFARYVAARKQRLERERAEYDPERAMADLPPGTVLVYLNSLFDSTTVLIVHRDAPPARVAAGRPEGARVSVESVRVPLSPEQALMTIGELRDGASNPDTPVEEIAAAGHRLYRTLFPTRSMRSALASARHIVVLPSGTMSDLPFGLLVPDTAVTPGFLGLRTPLSYDNSLYALARTRRPRAELLSDPPTALVMGAPVFERLNPRLPASQGWALLDTLPGGREEVQRVARLYDATPFLDTQASETEARRWLPGADIVHFATHGVPPHDELRHPEQVGLWLAQSDDPDSNFDGVLMADEIAREIPLEAELVVLSACETGRAWWGIGQTGWLAQGMLGAGARSVVVTQWRVSDESSPGLMEQFHRELLAGVDRDEALRRAEVAAASSPEFSHPYYWAPYRLSGDPARLPLSTAVQSER